GGEQVGLGVVDVGARPGPHHHTRIDRGDLARAVQRDLHRHDLGAAGIDREGDLDGGSRRRRGLVVAPGDLGRDPAAQPGQEGIGGVAHAASSISASGTTCRSDLAPGLPATWAASACRAAPLVVGAPRSWRTARSRVDAITNFSSSRSRTLRGTSATYLRSPLVRSAEVPTAPNLAWATITCDFRMKRGASRLSHGESTILVSYASLATTAGPCSRWALVMVTPAGIFSNDGRDRFSDSLRSWN